MAINLSKGQKVSLNKGVKLALVGLGWDTNRYSGGYDFDLDACAFLLGANGRVPCDEDFVFYGNQSHKSGSVLHGGDNRTGAGEGDDEQITVDLSRIPPQIGRLVFVVNIYDASARGQHFGMIRNAFIRLVDMSNENEICRFNLSEDYTGMTGMVVGEIYRRNGEWKFNAIGSGVAQASRLSSLVDMYR